MEIRAKISSETIIRGTVGKVSTEVANVTEVESKNFTQAAQNIQSLVKEGILIKTDLKKGAKAKQVTTEIANIKMYTSIFSDPSFLTEATNLLKSTEESLYTKDPGIEETRTDLNEYVKEFRTNRRSAQKAETARQRIMKSMESLRKAKALIDSYSSESPSVEKKKAVNRARR